MEPKMSLEHLHAYHATDREIFARLVVMCTRDPAESLLLMALWMWLEEKGYPNIIEKMTTVVDPVLTVLADESALALKCLEIDNLPPALLPDGSDMPFTCRIMEVNISLKMFLHNKFAAIRGIKNFLNTICSRIFTDILQLVLPWTSSPSSNPQVPLVVPGFPHPVFGGVSILPRTLEDDFPLGTLWRWDPLENGSDDERTMFLTFSRGFPVSKEEVTELFTSLLGNCVVSVQMQEHVPINEQPLFARMVLQSTTDVDQILKGKRIAKFRINGKHIWVRKYERRD